MIPMVSLKSQYEALKEEINPAILRVLADTQFILGPNVQNFEKEVSKYLSVKHAIGVANGTQALHLALQSANIGVGDEVITTAFTFIATAEAISYTGASIKFVDINPNTFNLDLTSVEKAISKKTKAILAVHLFGQPADVIGLQQLCEQYNLVLIEDAAQSFGARVGNKQTGSFGLAGCFSFFPSKNLGCYGDGGLVTTNDDAIARRVKSLRNHGSSERYYHDEIGYNSRLDELQAVILRIKLKYIDDYNSHRVRIAQTYSEGLADLPIQTPFADNIGQHVYHQYTVLSEQRQQIASALNEKQIASAIYYPVPLHQQNVYQNRFSKLILPVTEQVSQQCLSLPIFPEMSTTQVEETITTIKGVF